MGLPARPPPPRPFEPFSFPLPETVELGGGLQGLLLEDHRFPLAQLQIMLRAGLSAEPLDAPGAAYACACMIDEGAGSRSALQLSAALQEIGASLSLWAGFDSSNLSLQVLTQHLDRGLELLADVLLRPRFEAGEWRRVQKEVQGRGLQRRAEPGESAGLALSRLVFGEHPYARPIMPLPDEALALRLPAVRGFWKAHYHRDRALVVAAGDLDAAQLQAKLGRRLAGWRAGGAPTARARRGAEPPRPRGRRLGLVDRPGAPQSALRVGHVCPPRREVDWAAVRLLNTVFGGSFTSRLNLNLRERHGYTYGIGSAFHLTRGPSLLTVGTSVATENTAAALREILREMERLRQAKVSRAELDKARQLVVESVPAQAETLDDLAEEYAALSLHELPHDAIARLPEQVRGIDATRLRVLAEELLHPERATLIVVGDAARLRRELEPLADEIIPLDEDGRSFHRV
jgi:zinc protease